MWQLEWKVVEPLFLVFCAIGAAIAISIAYGLGYKHGWKSAGGSYEDEVQSEEDL